MSPPMTWAPSKPRTIARSSRLVRPPASGVAVGRRHPDHLPANDVGAVEAADHREELAAGEAAGLGRAGAGGESRVEHVDVYRDVDRRVADPLVDHLNDAVRP